MRKTYVLAGMAAITAALAVGAASAAGDTSASPCSTGTLQSGSYPGFTVTGTCSVPDGAGVTIEGDLHVAAGATFDARSMSTVTIDGSIAVAPGGRLELGCDAFAPGCPNSPTFPPQPGDYPADVVTGNVVANQPLTLRLDWTDIGGNVVSNGGGTGTDQFLNFPIKDNTIHGNLVVHGYTGGWFGVVRNHVDGNVDLSRIVSVVHPLSETDPTPTPGADSDSTEVQTNVVGGNLICRDNVPAAQVNPEHGGQPNTVAGLRLGECAGL
jgi:hypothetical protein